MKQFNYAFTGLSNAFELLFSTRLGWFFIWPIIITVLVWIVGGAMVTEIGVATEDYLKEVMGIADWDFWGAETIGNIIGWLLDWGIAASLYSLFAAVAGYVVLILLAPVLTMLSEKTETALTGNKYPFSLVQLFRDIIRSVRIVIRNFLIQLIWMAIFFLIGLFPYMGIIGSLGLFFTSAFFYGFSFMDYVNERRKLSVGESVAYIRKHRLIAMVMGGLYGIILLVPYGTYLGGFAAVICTAAASAAMFEVPEYAPYKKSEWQKGAQRD